MGMVTDVFWNCPKCDTKNKAQLYDWYEDGELPVKAIPSTATLKWNPPCTECGEYRLVEPPVRLVEFPIEKADENQY